MSIRGMSVLALSAVWACAVGAVTYTWQGGATGSWNEPANWSPNNGTPSGGDVAIFPAEATITDGFVISEGTLTITNNAADLHLQGVISGPGGLSVGGAGTLFLYQANTFEGPFVSEGNGHQKNGQPLVNNQPMTSGAVVIYNCGAMGTHSATFDPHGDRDGKTTPKADGSANPQAIDACSGSQLILSNCTGSVTIPVELPLDKPNNGTLIIGSDCGDITFTQTVSTRFRSRIRHYAPHELHFLKQHTHYNYANYHPMTSGAKIFIHEGETGSVGHFASGHLDSEIHYAGRDKTKTMSYFFSGSGTIVCDNTNTLGKGWSYFQLPNKSQVQINLNGFSQEVTGLPTVASRYVEYPATDWGFYSPVEKERAEISFAGANIVDFAAHCHFRGAAGVVWNPSNDCRLTLTNTVSDTVGNIAVSHGSVLLDEGAAFTQLNELSVAEGAQFIIGEKAGTCGAATLRLAAAGSLPRLVLGTGQVLTVQEAHVGDDALAFGSYTAAKLPGVIDGDGVLVVRSLGQQVAWQGPAAGGAWNDPANWEGGVVPGAGKDACIVGVTNVVIDATPAEMPHAIIVGGTGAASSIVFTNWNTVLSATYIDVLDGGVVTVASAFTNEAGKARVQLACDELTVSAGGRIDVTSKGWDGGYWLYPNSQTRICIRSAGLGPGGSSSTGHSGASHGGHGGYLNVECCSAECYDNPYAPVEPGSGGAMPQVWGYGVPHAGGGVIRIQANRVCVNGEILADGSMASQSKASGYQHDTAASGGSIWITCGHIEGYGLVRAKGGEGCLAAYPPSLFGSNGNNVSCDLCTGPAGGGGMVCVEVTNAQEQAAAAVAGLRLSAEAGRYDNSFQPEVGCGTLATYDTYNTDAEAGTLVVTDAALRERLMGNGLSGRLVGISSYTYEGDLEWTWGEVGFAAEGFAFHVTGDFTLATPDVRLNLGDVCWTNKRCAVKDVWGGTAIHRLIVDGDLSLANGATIQMRAAETNATMRWGAEVAVDGALTIGADSCVYAAGDPVNLSAVRFRVGALDVQQGGTLSATRRGAAGGWGSNSEVNWLGCRRKNGFGSYDPDAISTGGSHGGVGGVGVKKDGGLSDNAKVTPVYDDMYRPFLPGAGGNSAGWGEGGTGGGVVYLEALGAITVNGTVSADGAMAGYFYWSGTAPNISTDMDHVGAGAGGTVHLCGNTIQGSGLISAVGGRSGQYAGGAQAAGGGGRVALWTNNGLRATLGEAVRFKRATVATEQCAFAGTIDVAGGHEVYPVNYDNPSGKGNGVGATLREAAFGADGTIGYGTVLPQLGARIFFR